VKVLVAEVSDITRRLLEANLRRWGYEVVLAGDGAAALQALQATDGPSLAILDWMMPGLDGIEVCPEVRTQGREPYVFIILLTGKDGRTDVVQGLQSGADDYQKAASAPSRIAQRFGWR
jgi:DNA-binding response OmpR family regulator